MCPCWPGSQPSLFRNLNTGCSGSPSEGQVLGTREDSRRGDASMDWRGLGWGPGGRGDQVPGGQGLPRAPGSAVLPAVGHRVAPVTDRCGHG